MRDHLVDRLPRVDPARIDAMLREGRMIGRDGPLGLGSPFVPGSHIWFHRDLPDEVPVPFEIGIVHRDDDILVVDKPHFLATIPRGRHIVQSALVRLRAQLGLPQLSPAHRLDRVTAGLVLFVIRPELRGKYQTMFRDRRVRKTYEAVARHDPGLKLPRTVRSRIVKERGVLRAQEVPGEPNAQTLIELVGHRDGVGRYRLHPLTGRTHQLRLHMAGLGIPILGDDFYGDGFAGNDLCQDGFAGDDLPAHNGSAGLRERPLDDFSSPLQLLARSLEYTDPVSGVPRRFDSRLRLREWAPNERAIQF